MMRRDNKLPAALAAIDKNQRALRLCVVIKASGDQAGRSVMSEAISRRRAFSLLGLAGLAIPTTVLTLEADAQTIGMERRQDRRQARRDRREDRRDRRQTRREDRRDYRWDRRGY